MNQDICFRYDEIIGQQEAVSRLKRFGDFYRRNRTTPGHVLLIGPQGIGRRTLAQSFAREQDVRCLKADAASQKRLIFPGDITAILTNATENQVVLVANMDSLKRDQLDWFVPILKDSKLDIIIGTQCHRMDLKRFTFIGTISQQSKFRADLLATFSLVLTLEQYSTAELHLLALSIAARLGTQVDYDAAELIVANSAGLPSRIELLTQRLKAALNKPLMTGSDVRQWVSLGSTPAGPRSQQSSKKERAQQTSRVENTIIKQNALDQVLTELNQLIGLEGLKRDVSELVNYVRVQQVRKAQGLKTPDLSLHMVFYGNPGTGKTTVARLLAEIYREIGVLPKGQLVETDRSGMVAGYVGQTALKVREVVNTALGGILFIDEAYALKPKNASQDFGDEAIETLLKMMEDHREDLIVIVAGYPEEMKRFLNANPGLQSRFNKYLVFEDYKAEELGAIFRRFCAESDYSMTPEAEHKVAVVFNATCQKMDSRFGNGRLARNFFEKAISRLANRVVSAGATDRQSLELLQAEDIPDFESLMPI